MRTSSRLGFNLVEVLVIVAVLAILAMFLIPAILKVRDVAGRGVGNNNLRQCAVAIHNYHDTHKRLPDAASTGGMYKDAGEERSMWFHLLPFVEADNVYRNNVHNAMVSAFLAPSDRYIGLGDGKINYVGNIRIFGYETLGSMDANNAVSFHGIPTGIGLASKLKPTMTCGLSFLDIKDGTANVFMVTTRYADCGSPVQSTVYSASPSGTTLAAGGPVPSAGAAEAVGKGGFFGAGAHDMPADNKSANAIFQTAPTLSECRADDSVFGHSFHTGGLSVALCDASVKSIDPKMSTTTFCRALCPSDGHPLDNDWTEND